MPAAAQAAGTTLLDRWLRPGRDDAAAVRTDICWLVGLALLLMGVGLGLRDPWPADEPRFALIAKDMLRSGDWLIPRVGGDLYADKPPFYFWLLALSMALTGSMRAGFLLPSLLAGVGTALLVYDLLRRAHGREVAFTGALVLLGTFQFVWQARQAQIDATLCFLTTLSLYGLLRHLCLGPDRRWFAVGWFAAGLGVITKGVGFLPLLVLLPYALLRWRGWPQAARHAPAPGATRAVWLWWPLAFLLAVGVWLLPMWLYTGTDASLLAYRNEILFDQTVTRYADAWHHHAPFWFFLVQVVPLLWLPLIGLVPWLWPRWRAALRDRQLLVALLLGWVLIVLLFFSSSSGKRGVYILPAVPALAMAAAPWLPGLLRRQGPRRLLFGLAVLLTVLAAGGALYLAVDASAVARLLEQYGTDPRPPLAIAAVFMALACWRCGPRDAFVAWFAVLGVTLVTVGLLVYPRIDATRSGRSFMARVEQASAGVNELGLVGAKEQYLLELQRPSVNFGHARWREKDREAADAAAWLAAAPGRALLVDEKSRVACFSAARTQELGRANRQRWYLVSGAAEPACVRRGDAGRAIAYDPGR